MAAHLNVEMEDILIFFHSRCCCWAIVYQSTSLTAKNHYVAWHNCCCQNRLDTKFDSLKNLIRFCQNANRYPAQCLVCWQPCHKCSCHLCVSICIHTEISVYIVCTDKPVRYNEGVLNSNGDNYFCWFCL